MSESDERKSIFYRNKEYFTGDEIPAVVLVHGNLADGNTTISREDSNRVMLIDKKCNIVINAFDTIRARISYIHENYSIIYPLEVLDRAGTPEMARIVKAGGVDAKPEPPAPPPYFPKSHLEANTLFEIEPYAKLVDFYARALLEEGFQTKFSWDGIEMTVEQARLIEANRSKKVLVVIRDNKNRVICTPFTEMLLDTYINIPHQLDEALQYYNKKTLMLVLYTI